jgi:hypothetical protein
VTNVFAVLRLLPMNDGDKGVEILALRHQITVLERQLGKEKVRFDANDRALLAALLHREGCHFRVRVVSRSYAPQLGGRVLDGRRHVRSAVTSEEELGAGRGRGELTGRQEMTDARYAAADRHAATAGR